MAKPKITYEGRYRNLRQWTCAGGNLFGYGDCPAQAYNDWIVNRKAMHKRMLDWIAVTKGQAETKEWQSHVRVLV